MRSAFITLSFLFLVGCSTPAYFTLPAQKFEAPQVKGQWKGGVELEIVQSIYVVTHTDTGDDPPATNGAGPMLEFSDADGFRLLDYGVGARLGLGHRFEVSGHSGKTEGPSALRVKFQGLGQPSESANGGEPEWLGSVFASYLYSYSKRDGGDNGDDSEFNFVDDVTVRIQNIGYDVGLSVGKRVSDKMIPYLTLAYTNLATDIRINNYDTNEEYKYDEVTTQLAINPALRFESSSDLYFVLEPSISQTKYSDQSAKWLVSWGLMAGVGW